MLNGPTPAYFSFIFGLFKQTALQFLQQIYVIKCPSYTRCRDSNPRPSESVPITTRPGLPPQVVFLSETIFNQTRNRSSYLLFELNLPLSIDLIAVN